MLGNSWHYPQIDKRAPTPSQISALAHCGNALPFLGGPVIVWADYATLELACVLLRSAKLLSERATKARRLSTKPAVHIKFDAGKAIV